MRAMLCASAVSLSAIVAAAGAAAPDTLVTRGGDGKIAPALATAWKAAGDSVTFELSADADAEALAQALTDSLAGAEIATADGKITIAGIPSDRLLEQLVSLHVGDAGVDPLAELAGVGGAVAMNTPEGGGSIRASRPTTLEGVPQTPVDHDPGERIIAQIVRVERGTFPEVTLTFKVRGKAKSGPLKARLRRGKMITAKVFLGTGDAGVDFTEPHTQRNIGAYFLAPGDRVTLHAIAEGDSGADLLVDWVERRARK